MNQRKPAGKGSAFLRGAAGMARTDDEIANQKAKAEQRKAQGNKPFRFYVPVGETRRIIITDDAPDFFMYEHSLKDADGKWGRLFSGCIKSFDNCPVCAVSDRESYYAMVLSCIDLTPFKTRDGHEVEFSRKLLIVKPAQQKKFIRFYNKEGTMRGAIFDMTRDGDKDSAIGNDIDFLEFADEDELATYTRSWKDKEGKKHTEDCGEPYVYEDLFEEPTLEGLRALVGGGPAPGSKEHAEREVGGRSARTSSGRRQPAKDDDWDNADDDAKFDADPPKRTRARDDADDTQGPARRTRSRAPVEEADDAEEAAPARTRSRPAEKEDAPTRRAARRPTAEDAEPEDDDGDAPPPRRGQAATRGGAATRRPATRKPAIDDDDIPF